MNREKDRGIDTKRERQSGISEHQRDVGRSDRQTNVDRSSSWDSGSNTRRPDEGYSGSTGQVGGSRHDRLRDDLDMEESESERGLRDFDSDLDERS
ncbi:MAG: hypothetical protein ACYC7A_12655 [Thermoanaerobaculia bacterium]